MLRGMLAPMEKHHGVRISDEAVVAAVQLSARYIPARQLPDKAVSLLDTACARVAICQSHDAGGDRRPQGRDRSAAEGARRAGARGRHRPRQDEERIAELKAEIAETEAKLAELEGRVRQGEARSSPRS